MNFPYFLSLFTLTSLTNGADSVTGTAGADFIEGLAGNDTLIGLGGNDVLSGGAGNDSLSGGDGDDLLIGGAGDDTLDGGAGFDVVSYENATAAVRVNLADTLAGNTGGAGRDLLRSIEGVIGSIYNDLLEGDAGANLLMGYHGNDYLRAGKGNDTLLGGLGNDTLDGGDGIDVADYSDIQGGVTVTLMTTSRQNTGAGGWDVLLGIENLTGSSGHDLLTGSKGNNLLTGGAGNDTLNGEAGADTLVGGLGDDVYHVDSALDVVIEAENEGTDTVIARVSYTLSAHVENLTLAESVFALTGTGNALDNVLNGNALSNLLVGGDGDDTLWGGAGNDTLNGGAGSDTATYFNATAGLVLNLSLATGQAVGVFGTDVLISIENLIGGSGNDRLIGNEAANRLVGGAGRDSLSGGGGNDTLDGGLGDDSLEGGAGNDLLFGGAGNDTLDGGAGDNTLFGGDGVDVVRYGQALEDVSVTWQAGTGSFLVVTATARDVVSGVEQFIFGTKTYAATFLQATRLTTGDDIATASAAGDLIYGFGGNDSLTGGLGADTLYGGTGNDTLIGGGGNDLLMGEEGNDLLYAGVGNDTVNGGEGYDVLYVPDSFAQLTITYANGTYTISGPSGVVTATEIEALYCGTDLVTNRLPPRVSLSSAETRVIEGNEGSREIQFTVTLERAALFDVTAQYAVSAVTAGLTAEDFLGTVLPSGTVTIAAGATSATFSLWIASDTTYEGAETFAVTLSNLTAGAFLLQPSVSITIEDDDIRLLTMGKDLVSGTAGTDRIDGLAGDDVISGLDGNDILWGGAGRDTLYGGAGNDTLYGGAGEDRLYGDAGIDTVSYENSAAGVNANLKTGYAQSALEGTDRLYDIENLIGGAGNDTLTGSAVANLLIGNAGNDILDGGAGADTLIGGIGDDTYYVDNLADVVTELADEGNDTIITTISLTLAANVENLQLAGTARINGTGNGLNNRIMGNSSANVLSGGAGRDTLTGGQGNDTLIGGGGVDWFNVDSGTDSVEDLGGSEVLVVSAGAAADVKVVADFTATSATALNGRTTMVLADGVTANLTQATGSRGVTLSAAFNTSATVMTGTQRADSLIGGAGADVMNGGDGDDTLTGGAGNDTLTGGSGADTFNIDAGNDRVTDLGGSDVLNVAAAASVQAVVTSNYTATAATLIRGVTEITVANGLLADLSKSQGTRGVTLSAAGNSLGSFLTGTNRADTLVGGAGNDTLNAGAGNDAVYGGAGDDILVGASDDSLLDGGEGFDTLLTTVNFTAASDAQIIGIEQVFLMANNLKADFSTQSEGFRFQGYDQGASLIIGGMGNDTLIGGTGNDTLVGGAGNDRLEGGAGANSLSGGDGDDTLVGFQADVLLSGGAGNDTLLVSANFTSTSDGQIVGIETVELTATGIRLNLTNQTEDLVMVGFATGASTLIGGSGNDVLSGGSGNDSFVGGGGVDMVSYAAASAAVSVDLGLGTAQNTGGAGTDSFSGIEGLIGSAFDDQLTGDGGANILSGGLGNDILSGGGGNDLIDGGGGADWLYGGDGDDTLIGEATDEVIDGGDGADSLHLLSNFAARDDDQIVNIETVVLKASGLSVNLGNQTEDLILIGHLGGSSAIVAGQGNDSLTGGSDDDTLTGGAGNDTLVGGLGNDILTGGEGSDVFVFNSALGAANVDTIVDFDIGADMVWLSKTVMAGLGATDVALEAGAFFAGVNPRFSGDLGADHRVLYDENTGDLFYDADGNGAAAAIRFANIGPGLDLTFSNFWVIG